MSPQVVVPALVAVAAGAGSLYLTAPRRLLPAPPWPPLAGRTAGAGLLLFAWVWLSREASTAAAFFMVLTLGMTVLTALPVLAAFARRERE